MQIVLLSGGSGTRLWPLSNDARSKQFIRLLPSSQPGETESMLQRVISQIHQAKLNAPVTIATSHTQQDAIVAQLGHDVNIVTEPCRRDTFPAICLAAEYLSLQKKCPDDEVVVIMPCDPYTDVDYFKTIARMARCVQDDIAPLVLMGIKPTYPSAKYGYVVPRPNPVDGIYAVEKFTEKPTVERASQLISQGAMWNGGVFAFRLGYITQISRRYVKYNTFEQIRNHYTDFPKISFDYEVAEKASSIAMVPFDGQWHDLGTWNTLTEQLTQTTFGNVTTDSTTNNTHIINELEIPIMCIGTNNLVIAASPDGILVSEKKLSENIKSYADRLKRRPMYEERSWGTYRVLSQITFEDGTTTTTKLIQLHKDCKYPATRHQASQVTWTLLDGKATATIGKQLHTLQAGCAINLPTETDISLIAQTPATLIQTKVTPPTTN